MKQLSRVARAQDRDYDMRVTVEPRGLRWELTERPKAARELAWGNYIAYSRESEWTLALLPGNVHVLLPPTSQRASSLSDWCRKYQDRYGKDDWFLARASMYLALTNAQASLGRSCEASTAGTDFFYFKIA